MTWRGRPLSLMLAAAVGAAGCAATVPPPKSQLEVREIQTRTFDTSDTKLVMKAMLNVLQDDGYVVRNAVVDLGLITAAKDIDLAPRRSEPIGGDFVGARGAVVFGFQGPPLYRKTEVHEFTGNVTEFGKQTRVRVNIQRKVLDNRGGVLSVQAIEDAQFYQDFFSRVDKSVYLQREQL
jgi:hypothetical protein